MPLEMRHPQTPANLALFSRDGHVLHDSSAVYATKGKTLHKLQEFFDFMPHLKGMKLYGIISAVDVRGALADRVLHEGLYLATAGDEGLYDDATARRNPAV